MAGSEFRRVTVSAVFENNEARDMARLNELGEQGFEIVHVCSDGHHDVIYLSRPKPGRRSKPQESK